MNENLNVKPYNTFGTDESENLKIIKQHGFKPIAITIFMGEEVIVFRTSDEAAEAFKQLTEITGNDCWWYGLDGFKKEYEWYKTHFEPDDVPLVYWLPEYFMNNG